MAQPMKVTIEDARVIYPNFSGRPDAFSDSPGSNFCVVIPEAVAQDMLADGWNIKQTNVRDDEGGDEQGDWYLPIALSWKIRPPMITMIVGKSRTTLNEDTIEILDSMDIEMADVIVNSSRWETGGKSGIKAYAHSLYVVIREDELQKKWAVDEDE